MSDKGKAFAVNNRAVRHRVLLLAISIFFIGVIASGSHGLGRHSHTSGRAVAAPRLKAVALPEHQRQISFGYGPLPMSFELNEGQTDKRVRFLSRGRGYAVFLTSNEAVLALEES